jgi:hypothetical protein
LKTAVVAFVLLVALAALAFTFNNSISVNGNVQIAGAGHGVIFPNGTKQTSAPSTTAYYTEVAGGSFAAAYQPILSLSLPAGTFVVQATLNYQTASVNYDATTCKFVLLPGGSSQVGATNTVNNQNAPAASYYQNLPMTTVFPLQSPGTVKLECWDSVGATVAQATMLATPVQMLHMQLSTSK